jgi:hypothetical protein
VYVELVVPITDAQFKLGVGGVAIVLVAVIATGRFCGSVAIPPKPSAPLFPTGTETELISQVAASPGVYQDYLAKDAAAAGVPVPSLDEMARKLPYRFDDKRRILEVGEPAIEIAGLALAIVKTRQALVLEIENRTGTDVAYHIVTEPIPTTNCNSAQPLPFNAVVLVRGTRASRVECSWRTGISLVVTRVELVELSPLATWYITQVPPPLLGIEPRIARGHQAPSAAICSSIVSHALESGLKTGEIVWRDLVDFYSRYRCQTYQFPLTYRAVGRDAP